VTTFNELTDDAQSMLRGYVRSQEQSTYLAGPVNELVTTFDVGDGTRLGMGRAEIDDELVFIDAITNNSVALQPWGRGVDGSTVATHAANARVTFNPLFPRHFVKRAINNTIYSIGVELKARAESTFTYTPAVSTYSLPATTVSVQQVSWDTLGPSGEWQPARRWRFDRNADTTDYPTGKTLSLWDAVVPGRTVKVAYMKEPSLMSAGSDTLETTSGLPTSCRDVVVLGAVAALVASVDIAVLDPSSVQAGFFDERRQIGTAGNVARTVYALYRQRLDEEIARFRDQTTAPIHFEG
jgi:hypothetical protein